MPTSRCCCRRGAAGARWARRWRCTWPRSCPRTRRISSASTTNVRPRPPPHAQAFCLSLARLSVGARICPADSLTSFGCWHGRRRGHLQQEPDPCRRGRLPRPSRPWPRLRSRRVRDPSHVRPPTLWFRLRHDSLVGESERLSGSQVWPDPDAYPAPHRRAADADGGVVLRAVVHQPGPDHWEGGGDELRLHLGALAGSTPNA